MAKAALRILTDEAAYASQCQRARARAMELFQADAVIDRYESLYRDVVARN
jgi:glycosyltransferase involved in cell wall biosynthesis